MPTASNRQVGGLDRIIWSPFLHGDWAHLFGNLGPGLVLGFLLLMARRFLVVTGIVWVISGVGVWLTAPAYSGSPSGRRASSSAGSPTC